jgi:inositol polyphosphate 5-phosphatase INPP5J/K
VFFFGDLNFRLKKLDNKTIENKIFNKEYENLEYDQLKHCISNNECFNEFNEAKIKFAPTYKYDINKDTYDTSSKKRRAAWCDRILYKLNTQNNNNNINVNELEYNTLNNYKHSDHRPVYGIYLLNLPLNGEMNSIDFEIISSDNNKVEFIFKVNNYEINSNDWIAIYDYNFTHSNDYISYLWVNNSLLGTKQLFEFIDDGSYYLAYFSYKQDQIISLSEKFEIKSKQKIE